MWTDIHAPSVIRAHDPSVCAGEDTFLRQRRHTHRLSASQTGLRAVESVTTNIKAIPYRVVRC
jgi:hypothetical protein